MSKKIMAGHWVGNVFVMCWSKRTKAHQLDSVCQKLEVATKKADEINTIRRGEQFQLTLEKRK